MCQYEICHCVDATYHAYMAGLILIDSASYVLSRKIFSYGIFVDRSEEWDSLTSNERNKMGLTLQSDGEFWLPFSEFCTFFTHVEICHFVNTSFFSLKKTWTESLLRGEWTTGAKDSKKDRSGGCDDFDSYLENPQVCS